MPLFLTKYEEIASLFYYRHYVVNVANLIQKSSMAVPKAHYFLSKKLILYDHTDENIWMGPSVQSIFIY